MDFSLTSSLYLGMLAGVISLADRRVGSLLRLLMVWCGLTALFLFLAYSKQTFGTLIDTSSNFPPLALTLLALIFTILIFLVAWPQRIFCGVSEELILSHSATFWLYLAPLFYFTWWKNFLTHWDSASSICGIALLLMPLVLTAGLVFDAYSLDAIPVWRRVVYSGWYLAILLGVIDLQMTQPDSTTLDVISTSLMSSDTSLYNLQLLTTAFCLGFGLSAFVFSSVFFILSVLELDATKAVRPGLSFSVLRSNYLQALAIMAAPVVVFIWDVVFFKFSSATIALHLIVAVQFVNFMLPCAAGQRRS